MAKTHRIRKLSRCLLYTSLGLQAVPDEEIVRIHSSSGTTGTPVIIPYTQQDVTDWAIQFARCYELSLIHIFPRSRTGTLYPLQDFGGSLHRGSNQRTYQRPRYHQSAQRA